MKVKIQFMPNTTSEIKFIEQVKNISKDLMETCAKCGVIDLTYKHDYFEIHIEQSETIQLQHVAPLYQCEDKGE